MTGDWVHPSKALFCVIWVIVAASNGPDNEAPQRNTQLGWVKGKRVAVQGSPMPVNVFLGVPFAAPPLGPLRFTDPQPARPWNDLRDATSYPKLCFQNLEWLLSDQHILKVRYPTFEISEDCLYLNIYAPVPARENSKLPVMVWFPGGAFETGSASIFDGSALAAYENVLVVTTQYRLGIFGFFTTQDQHASGNWGFKDQLAALSWVQKNINFFGGDPGRVTIFGESAGGISVSSLVLSPMATGLFHRAIMESGVAIIPYLKSADDQRSKDLQIVAEACDCNASDSLALLTCLREKSSKELLSLGQKTKSFTRVVDGHFFPEEPLELLTQQTFKTVPSIIGVNNHECGYLLPMKTIPDIIDGANKSFALHVIRSILNIPAQLLYVVSDEYFYDKHSSVEIRDSLLDLLGDVFFVVPALITARYHRDSGAPIYFYEFQHRPQCFEDTKPAFVKADHSDEIRFVFGGAFLTGDVVMFGQTTAPPVVNTRQGKVLGKFVSVEGVAQPVAVFLGIPFAKPPLGSLRFAPPEPAESWSYVKNTTSYPPRCPQIATVNLDFNPDMKNTALNMSEDCLYLNVYTPSNLVKKSRLPVMVWIHGGVLLMGSASEFSGLAMAAHENVVVVTVQYRLGIWGFFSTGDEHSRGNWGHWDQVAALRWVRNNIANFGGNPGSVTVFGESAGAQSVSVLVLSPLAKNLFRRAISESGVALIPGIFSRNPKPLAEKIAVTAGCSTTTSAVMVHCLRQKTEEELLEVTREMKFFVVDFDGDPTESYIFMTTVVDGVLLPKAPEEILAEKKFNKVPYIVGFNKQEFGWNLPSGLGYPLSEEGLDQDTATELLWKSYPVVNISKELIPMAIEKYLGGTDDPVQKKGLFMDMMGDLLFCVPSVVVARYHRDAGAPTYMYEFGYRPSFSPSLRPSTVIGDHADELFSVFGIPLLTEGVSEEELQLSKRMMKFWANFARNGNPNGKGLPQWPKYDRQEGYLQFGASTQAGQKLKDEEVAFWTELLARRP